jgi:hypothetical protein
MLCSVKPTSDSTQSQVRSTEYSTVSQCLYGVLCSILYKYKCPSSLGRGKVATRLRGVASASESKNIARESWFGWLISGRTACVCGALSGNASTSTKSSRNATGKRVFWDPYPGQVSVLVQASNHPGGKAVKR